MDKTFIFILILILMAGIVSWDKYLASKGEVGPVAKFIDFAGLAKYGDKPTVTKKVITESFRAELKDNLSRLREKHLALQAKRMELVRNREEVLAKLEVTDGKLNREALKYADVLGEERKKFERQFPQIVELGQKLLSNYDEMDVDLRNKKYDEIKSEVMEILGQLSSQSKEDVAQITGALADIKKILNEDKNVLSQVCDYASGVGVTEADFKAERSDVEEKIASCIRAKLGIIQGLVQDKVQETFVGPSAELHEMSDSADLLKREQLILKDNESVCAAYFENDNKEMDASFQELVETFVEVTEDDLMDLMAIYDDLSNEQEMLFDSLEINRDRFYQTNHSVIARLNSIIKGIRKLLVGNYGSLFDAYKEFIAEHNNLVAVFNDNEQKIDQLSKRQWEDNRIFINDLGVQAGFDVKKLMEKRRFARQDHKKKLAQYEDLENNIKLRRSLYNNNASSSFGSPSQASYGTKLIDANERNIQDLRDRNARLMLRNQENINAKKQFVDDQIRRLREKNRNKHK